MKPTILIVDDEESVRESFRLALKDDYDLLFAEDARTTLRVLKEKTFDLCLLDIMLPDGSGLDLLRQMKRRESSIDVIMVTALSGLDTALTAMKGAAKDYITKPFNINELRATLKRVLALKAFKKGLPTGTAPQPLALAGESKSIRGLVNRLDTVAQNDGPVWLMGDKGSGLEDIALEIHSRSPRKNGPFITYSCCFRAKQRLQMELFGHEIEGKLPQIGKLEFADGGTLFLKDIDRIPLSVQDRLLNALTSRTMSRMKARTPFPLDVRLIVTSGVNLNSGMAQKIFLKKFYRYLVNTVITVPTLSERKSDIPALMDQVIEAANPRAKVAIKSVQKEVVQLMSHYPWPGDLVEFQNILETMVLFAGKEVLTLDDIPLDILIRAVDSNQDQPLAKLSLHQLHYQFEYQYIRKVLENTLGNQTRAAQVLGLHRNTLISKLKKLKLDNYYRDIVRRRREGKASLAS